MQAAENQDPLGLRNVEQAVWEPPEKDAPHRAMDHGMTLRMSSDARDTLIESSAEVIGKLGATRGIPGMSFADIRLGLGCKVDS